MKKKSTVLLIILGIIVVLGGALIGSYNGMVSSKELVDNKMADIDVQLQRRTDLIPNLIATVKGYVSHEESIIEEITTARENLINATTATEKAEAYSELSSSLSALAIIVENYPDLKANENFINLQDELAGTENRIAIARKEYNDAAKEYNGLIKKIPNNIITKIFNFTEVEYFRATPESQEVPEVNFE